MPEVDPKMGVLITNKEDLDFKVFVADATEKELNEKLINDKDFYKFIERIAHKCHLLNNMYCKAIGDPVAPDWGRLDEAIRIGSISAIIHIICNKNVTPQELHERWMQSRLKDGWVYGEKKDFNKKTHPDLVPYDKLPASQKFKDSLFKFVVSNFVV